LDIASAPSRRTYADREADRAVRDHHPPHPRRSDRVGEEAGQERQDQQREGAGFGYRSRLGDREQRLAREAERRVPRDGTGVHPRRGEVVGRKHGGAKEKCIDRPTGGVLREGRGTQAIEHPSATAVGAGETYGIAERRGLRIDRRHACHCHIVRKRQRNTERFPAPKEGLRVRKVEFIKLEVVDDRCRCGCSNAHCRDEHADGELDGFHTFLSRYLFLFVQRTEQYSRQSKVYFNSSA
jgi:hypothetical protein